MAKQYHGKTLVPECVWRLRPTMSPISSLSKQHWTATRLWNHYWYLAYSPITNTIRTLVFPVASPEKKLFEVFILHEEWQCSTVSTKYKSDRIVFKSQCTPAVQAIDCACDVRFKSEGVNVQLTELVERLNETVCRKCLVHSRCSLEE